MITEEPDDLDQLVELLQKSPPNVLVVMGSQSDWRENEKDGVWKCCQVLEKLNVRHQPLIVSAHRTPERLYDIGDGLDGKIKVVVAAAGGAAHLPGMMAALMRRVPVIGLPMKSNALNGLDSLYSIVQMPPAVPVGTMAIGGAENAALYAAMIVGVADPELRKRIHAYRNVVKAEVAFLPDSTK